MSKVVMNAVQAMDFCTATAAALKFAGSVSVDEDSRELITTVDEDSIERFLDENKKFFGGNRTIYGRATQDFIRQALKTLEARQQHGTGNNGSFEFNVMDAASTLYSFFQTHMDNDGDDFTLTEREAGGLGITVAPLLEKNVQKGMNKFITALKVGDIVNPQMFDRGCAASINYIFGKAWDLDPDGGWLSLDNVESIVNDDLASGALSEEGGKVIIKVFKYGLQGVYDGEGQGEEICIDMEGEFQRSL